MHRMRDVNSQGMLQLWGAGRGGGSAKSSSSKEV